MVNPMSTFESELESAAADLASEFFSGRESEDGPGQRAAKEQLLSALAQTLGLTREQTLAVVADAGRMQDVKGNKLTSRKDGKGNGKTVRPEPDLAYNATVGGTTRRINVEIDSNPNAAVKHMKELKKGDRKGQHVAIIVDPVSGRPVDGMVWNPTTQKARKMRSGEILRLQNGQLPATAIPQPIANQSNKAVPPRKAKSPNSIAATLQGGIATLNRSTPAARKGSRKNRESELSFAAAEFESEFGFSPEQMDVDIPGIPGSNQWFSNSGEARKAALRDARELGLGYRLLHDSRPARGQPHYHILTPNGSRVSGHYFYGRKPPRRVYRGRPYREFEFSGI